MLLPGRCSSLTQQQSALTMIDAANLPMWLVDGGRVRGHLFNNDYGGPMSKELHDVSAALESVVAGLAPSLVSVISDRSRASGFVWRAGLIVTSDEGLADESSIQIGLPGGEVIPAQLVGRDASTAVAMLKVERTDLPPVALAAAIPAAGALVLAIGAEESAPTAALGVLSVSRGPWQSLRGGEIDARIELDARLRRTAEGGLAVNAAGQVFGMTVFGPRRRALVIPSSTVGRVASQLEAHGRVARGYLGLGLQPVAIEGGGSGVMVMSVDAAGPGAAANIHQGDVLVNWDGDPFSAVGALPRLLRSLGPTSVGKVVAIELRRGGQTHRAQLQIGERPPA
jgi:S1-C subfamily serine protease